MNTAITDVEVRRGEFTWEIRAWSALPTATGAKSESATFECAGDRWGIVVYPGGSNAESMNHVSIYLAYRGDSRFVVPTFAVEAFDQTTQAFNVLVRGTSDKFGAVNIGAENIRRTWGQRQAMLRTSFLLSCCLDDRVRLKAAVEVRGVLCSTVWQAAAWRPPRTWARDMAAMWLDRDATGDGVLSVGETKLRVHKCLVANRSAPLRASFFGELASPSSEVVVEEVEANVVYQLLRCIYTDECDAEALAAMPEALLQAGDRFGVDRMVYLSEKELVTTLAVRNAGDRLQLADKHVVAAHLKEACIDFIHRRFHEVQETDGWKRLVAAPQAGRLVAEVLRETQNRLKRPRESFSELLLSPDGVRRMRVDELRTELQRRGQESFGLREQLEDRLASAIRDDGLVGHSLAGDAELSERRCADGPD